MDEALKLVENDEYQTEIVKENAEDGKVYGHKLLNHVDFTSPVSLEDAGKVKVFKVLSVAGAYWKRFVKSDAATYLRYGFQQTKRT